jgi:hypothetical protein
MRSNTLPFAILLVAIASPYLQSQKTSATEQPDKYLYLEDASSPRALA